MKPLEVTLEEFVAWAVLFCLFLAGAQFLFRILVAHGRRSKSRKTTRRCVQCHLREDVTSDAPKFGECQACGGVTTKGRSRKLG